MTDIPTVYGLDLLTSAVGTMIDPEIDAIATIGLSRSDDDKRFDDEEGERILLIEVDAHLRALPAGIIATWDGSILAFPLLRMRADRWDVQLGLLLEDDRRAAPLSPVLGVEAASRGVWHHHQLLDLRRVYEQSAEPRRWNPLARGRRSEEDLIPPSNELADRDPLKDARLARQLAERRWPQARRCVDVITVNSNSRRTSPTG